MPVFPAVASTTRPPGLSSPRFSASRIIHLPARSFTDLPGFMNSALPRIAQPVSSEARFSLISGVWPIASTTSLWIFMRANSSFEVRPSESRVLTVKGKAGFRRFVRCDLSGSRKHHLTDVDIARQESGLAIGEIVLPQPPKPVVETKRDEIWPGSAEVVSPGRERLGIILPENA